MYTPYPRWQPVFNRKATIITFNAGADTDWRGGGGGEGHGEGGVLFGR